jgi:shikimate kinase
MNNDAPRIIVITGFMAAGKTTVAQALARRLSSHLIDLDAFITELEGHTPRAIIDEHGEAYFRAVETGALRLALEQATIETTTNNALSENDAPPNSTLLIIALGGGAWTLERNRVLLAQHNATTVWLDAPFDLCWQRINSPHETAARPLARLRDEALKLYRARRAFYELATHRVEVAAEQDAQMLAAHIASLIPA